MNYSEPLAISNLSEVNSHHIALLSQRLDELYQAMKNERLAIANWEEEQEFSILGVMELFSTEVQGYVEQLKLDQFTSPFDHNIEHLRHIEHLRQLSLFRVDYFARWYFQNLERYPQTKQYVEQLDHLRLAILEYFNQRLSAVA